MLRSALRKKAVEKSREIVFQLPLFKVSLSWWIEEDAQAQTCSVIASKHEMLCESQWLVLKSPLIHLGGHADPTESVCLREKTFKNALGKISDTLDPPLCWYAFLSNQIAKNSSMYVNKLKMGFSNLRDSGICAMNNFEFWRQISLLLFVVCFLQQIISQRFAAKIQNCSWHRYHYRVS